MYVELTQARPNNIGKPTTSCSLGSRRRSRKNFMTEVKASLWCSEEAARAHCRMVGVAALASIGIGHR